ncbi:Hypothetical_protein [Hexamita inflata]|uniref:Hypothetical_protein n=1 Tax=Hexamita inflata TaxID=28002 RepID=A0AA86TNN2_9EUKA|nr:Hypothetical protein HINF_LOCUS10741 [Hexamita inflata]
MLYNELANMRNCVVALGLAQIARLQKHGDACHTPCFRKFPPPIKNNISFEQNTVPVGPLQLTSSASDYSCDLAQASPISLQLGTRIDFTLGRKLSTTGEGRGVTPLSGTQPLALHCTSRAV